MTENHSKAFLLPHTFIYCMAATFELVSVCIAIWWEKSYKRPRHDQRKVQIVSKGTELRFSPGWTVNLDFPREHASKNDLSVLLLENHPLPPEQRAHSSSSPPWSWWHPCSSGWWPTQCSRVTHTASQACWDGEHEGYRNRKGLQWLSLLKNRSCIHMMSQNPRSGLPSKPPSPQKLKL